MQQNKPWQLFQPRLGIYKNLPMPVYMRAKDLPAYGEVVLHSHDWEQLIFALSGLLEVTSSKGQHLIPSGQAIWIPANYSHSIATVTGAKLRSVHIRKDPLKQFVQQITVLKVDPLTRLLIAKASEFFTLHGAANATTAVLELNPQQLRLLDVLIDQIAGLQQQHLSLPLTDDRLLLPILQALQHQPERKTTLFEWGQLLGASSKTIGRRFEAKLGMSYRRWREQLILHRAIQGLSENRPVTEVALSLGYESLPAFIHMFKKQTGVTPGKFICTE
ncbi:MAG: hypothetical protein OFPI_33980 [Osedax symbiont Rs2]|nr:MAG: hypothetical protein OFPI_33980 [Osedax symbiont Rs2]